MTFDPPVDDSLNREEDEGIVDEMIKMADDLLETLSPLQRAALFQDFETFRELYKEDLSHNYYDSLN